MAKHPGGRPLKFKSVKELKEKINEYFIDCDPHWVEETYWDYPTINGKKDKDSPQIELSKMVKTTQVPYTITGLALALGCDRDTLLNYEEREEYFGTIKEAKAKCHNYAERKLFEANATGPIFNLKNNYGWKDKTEIDNNLTGDVEVKLSAEQAEQLIRARRNRSDT